MLPLENGDCRDNILVGETDNVWTNARSALDRHWLNSYGGVDHPVRRRGYGPAGFRPLENPFYIALPYSDMRAGRLKPEAAKVVPWFIEQFGGLVRAYAKDIAGDPAWSQNLLCTMGGCRTVQYRFPVVTSSVISSRFQIPTTELA